MRLAPGTRLGPYEILAPIGAGGMARSIARAIQDSLLYGTAIITWFDGRDAPQAFAPRTRTK